MALRNVMNKDRRRALLFQLFSRQGGRCFYCWRETKVLIGRPNHLQPDDMATLDHKIALADRPDLSKARSNIVLACRKCNQLKGRKTVAEFMAEMEASGLPFRCQAGNVERP